MHMALADTRTQIPVFLLENAKLQGLFGRDHHLFQGQGFLDEIKSPFLDRAHGGLDGPMPGNHDNGNISGFGLHGFKNSQPIRTRQPDIQKNQTWLHLQEHVQTGFPVLGIHDLVSLILENAAHGKTDILFIIYDQNCFTHAGRLHLACSLPAGSSMTNAVPLGLLG